MTEKELDGARKVLNAAAMTYVAAFVHLTLNTIILDVSTRIDWRSKRLN